MGWLSSAWLVQSHFNPSNMVTAKTQIVQSVGAPLMSSIYWPWETAECEHLCQAHIFPKVTDVFCAVPWSSTQLLSSQNHWKVRVLFILQRHFWFLQSIRIIKHNLFSEFGPVYKIQNIIRVIYLRQLFLRTFQSLLSKNEILLEMRNQGIMHASYYYDNYSLDSLAKFN